MTLNFIVEEIPVRLLFALNKGGSGNDVRLPIYIF